MIAWQVEVKCRYGWPAVLKNSPFDERGNLNPNLFYLTCPYLMRKISQLEDAGLIESLQIMASKDAGLAAGLRAAHKTHSREWEEAAGGPIKTVPAGPRIAAAGADHLIKCLHAHFSWFLTHPKYWLGKIIAEQIGEIWCSDERCRQWMKEITYHPQR
jgi:hypothetical protein